MLSNALWSRWNLENPYKPSWIYQIFASPSEITKQYLPVGVADRLSERALETCVSISLTRAQHSLRSGDFRDFVQWVKEGWNCSRIGTMKRFAYILVWYPAYIFLRGFFKAPGETSQTTTAGDLLEERNR